MNRRDVLRFGSVAFTANVLGATTTTVRASNDKSIKAVAFDAFPIFDPQPVFARVAQMFPDHSPEFGNLWRTRQFEYQWLRALTGKYSNFRDVTEDALVYTAKTLKIDLSADQRATIMNAYLELRAWPDAREALASLKRSGLRLVFLSNATPEILQAAIRNSDLSDVFEQVLSTDAVRTFKPAPPAYRLGVDALRLPVDQILFVSSTAWDAAGAKSFGYPTFWVNRQKLPMDELGALPDGIGEGMDDLVRFLS